MSAPPVSGMRSSPVAALEARVAAHPWMTLGGVFLVGAWLALDPPHVPRNAFARAAFALIGSFALRVAREVALGELVARTARPMPATRPMWPARPMHS